MRQSSPDAHRPQMNHRICNEREPLSRRLPVIFHSVFTVRSADFIAIRRHFKAQTEYFGRTLAHNHTLKENLKVVDHRAD